MLYAPYRMYSSKYARWNMPDPMGTGDGPNVIAYVNNRPIGSADPLGLWRFSGTCWIHTNLPTKIIDELQAAADAACDAIQKTDCCDGVHEKIWQNVKALCKARSTLFVYKKNEFGKSHGCWSRNDLMARATRHATGFTSARGAHQNRTTICSMAFGRGQSRLQGTITHEFTHIAQFNEYVGSNKGHDYDWEDEAEAAESCGRYGRRISDDGQELDCIICSGVFWPRRGISGAVR